MNLLELFAARCRDAPAAIALQWREAQWSYEDVDCAIAAVKASLCAAGLQKGDRVALLLRNSPQYVASFYGVLAAGGAAVALNAQERAGVLARQITHSAARFIIGDPAHLEWGALRASVADRGVSCIEVKTLDTVGALKEFLDTWSADRGTITGVALRDEDVALLIYTSGTTGRPKAVTLSHRNLSSNAEAIIEYLGLRSSDCGFCVLPFHFSYGNSLLTSHLSVGARLVIEDNLAFPRQSLQRLAETRATGFAGVPSTFTLLLSRCRLTDYDLSALRYVTQAGGAMTRTGIAQLKRELPNTRVFVMYGQTEATARISYLPPDRLEDKLGSVGLPVAGTEITICDADGRPLPTGEIGEVRVRGPGVMLGYWEDPSATQEVIRDGWLCTGDLGHKDADGFLYIDGRAIEMITVGAFRVSPYEVEEVIGSLPSVEEVAVTGTADDVLGQAVKAIIVLRPGAKLSAQSVKAHCRAQLAAYKIPKVVEFVSKLPRTGTGKVQRLQLA